MKILITGGAGYVGQKLIAYLVAKNHQVSSLDIAYASTGMKMRMLLNDNLSVDKCLEYIEIKGDIRNLAIVHDWIKNCDVIIHLACISNDPSFDLDPALGKSINYDAFRPLVKIAKDAGVKRFIYASSSSVYGVKKEKEVTEDLSLEPLTDYSKYKAMCEEVLNEEREPGFETVIVRPATICGYSPSMRFDLSVHILTLAAVREGKITIFGGQQYRPHIHIDDMINAYVTLLEAPAEKVDGQVFNVGHANHTMDELAAMVRHMVSYNVDIEHQQLEGDKRSYSILSDKIERVIGWKAKRSILSAIGEVRDCLKDGRITNPDDDKYYTIRKIKNMRLAA